MKKEKRKKEKKKKKLYAWQKVGNDIKI